jgi:hypothetical protein
VEWWILLLDLLDDFPCFNEIIFFVNHQKKKKIFTEHFSLEHSLINVQEQFFQFEDQLSLNILLVYKISYFQKILLIELMNPLKNEKSIPSIPLIILLQHLVM